MKTESIVVSAGVSRRLKAALRKPYLNLSGKPILIHTLGQLSASPEIKKIIVVVNKLDRLRCAALIKRYKLKKVKAIIAGGERRQDSVCRGLENLDRDTDIALIHDGVRPFIDRAIIKKSIACAVKFGACVVGVPVKATIKKVSAEGRLPAGRQGSASGGQKSKVKSVEETLERKNIWEIQTPQVFKKKLILEAYKRFGDTPATDDAMLVEKLGAKVCVVMGSYKNIKITTPEDLVIAKTLMSNSKTQNPK